MEEGSSGVGRGYEARERGARRLQVTSVIVMRANE